MKKLIRDAMEARRKLSILILRKRVPPLFTIISEDCWGGQLYRQLHIRYSTPTVGLMVSPATYLQFLECFHSRVCPELKFIPTKENYPVAEYGDSILAFMHYTSIAEAEEKFLKRRQRVCWDRILTKIDFGKPGYSLADIDRWNSLRLANSVAFYSHDTEIPAEGVHSGILVPDWVLDGAAMFDVSRRYFDVFYWVRTGNLRISLLYSIMNCVLFDPTSPHRLAMSVKAWLRRWILFVSVKNTN
jgi:uncharacterized protein (DUF1919 family)